MKHESLNKLSIQEKRERLRRMMEDKKKKAKPAHCPLSRAQRRLWLLNQVNPNRSDYNILNAYELNGTLHLDHFQRALGEIIQRHETLRTAFEMRDGEGVQVVKDPPNFQLQTIDLTSTPENERLEEAHRLTISETQKPFDQTQGFLYRFSLLKLADDLHIFLCILHHIISDTLSYRVISRELSALYNAFCEGKPSPLQPLTMQYRDFVAQEAKDPPERLAQSLQWWTERLKGIRVTELVPDFHRPPELTYNGAVVRQTMPPALSTQARELSREAGVSAFVTYLSAFLSLMYRYTGEDDVNCGTTMANRDSSQLQSLIGFFVNNIIIRAEFETSLNFRQLLAQVRDTLNGAHQHPDLPFERLVEKLLPERDPSRMPLCQLAFQFGVAPPLHLKEVQSGSIFSLDYGLVRTDLEFYLVEEAGRLECLLVYNRDLFKAETIEALGGHFEKILTGLLEDPELPIAHQPMLRDEEWQFLQKLNDTGKDYPDQSSIHEVFEQIAAAHPHIPALVFEGTTVTYGELERRANQLARHLRKQGLGIDQFAGLCYDRAPEMIIGMLAIIKAGGAYVSMDAQYPSERLQYILDDARPGTMVVQEDALAKLETLNLGGTSVVCLERDRAAIEQEPDGPLPVKIHPDNLVYAIYTSGSTGKPKGVVNVHRGMCNLATYQRDVLGIKPGVRVGQFFTINFDASVWEIAMTLINGGTLCLAPAHRWALGPELVKTLKELEVNVLTVTPSVLATLQGHDFPHLKTVIVAGEACTPELVAYWANKVILWNAYGPSEASVCATMHLCKADDPGNPPIGQAVANCRAFVVDSTFQLLPPGVNGELLIAGASLARGYFGKPALTAQKYCPDPFSQVPGSRVYRSGDLCMYRRDGQISFQGRIDFQVKLRGFRIELGEIEAVLASHPGVCKCIVLVLQKAAGLQRLVAYWSPMDMGGRPTSANLAAYLAERLPEYMVPANFVAMDALPLTRSGKIDRDALPDPSPEPVQQTKDAAQEGGSAARIAEIWKKALMIANIGLEDNFFEVGGNSVLLVQVHKALQDAFDQEFPIVELFRLSTIRSLAAFFDGEEEDAPLIVTSTASKATNDDDISVVSMHCRYPGVDGTDAFWEHLVNGREVMQAITDDQLRASGVPESLIAHPSYVKRVALLEDPYHFDAAFFGMNPREAEAIDPQQRLFLEAAWTLLEKAGYCGETYEGRIGVFAGVGVSFYMINLLSDPQMMEQVGGYAALVNNDKDFVATRVAYKLGLKGPAFTIQSACSTSLVAIHQAKQALLAGETEMAIAGGVAIRDMQPQGYFYQRNMIFSPDGCCRPFDADACGTFGGNGLALVLLKRTSDAVRDGDTILARIKGSAVNNDGHRKASYSAPGIDGQVAVIAQAIEDAQVDVESISYIEAHGTATEMGDPIEVASLTKAYRRFTQKTGFAHLGSVKANIGHLDTAAGVSGLIKIILCMQHETIPPLLHYKTPNPRIDFASSPARPNSETVKWTAEQGPRRAGISSFGIGGTNAHLVVEEAPAVAARSAAAGAQLLVVSARSEKAVQSSLGQLSAFLTAHPQVDLGDVAWTLRTGRASFDVRAAVAVTDAEGAVKALGKARPVKAGSAPAVAFLFSGQGSQYVGAARALYETEPGFREPLDRCLQLLKPHLEEDLAAVMFADGDVAAATEQLNQTRLAQPAIFAVSYALAQYWASLGVKPAAMLGHSIGEYAAATLAGVFTLEAAVALVAARGRLMQSLPPGDMLSVSASPEELKDYLSDTVSLAAVNGPTRCVLSGDAASIDAVNARLKDAGKATGMLHTSHAFHSHMMEPILDQFEALVAKAGPQAPKQRFVSNLTGDWAEAERVTNPRYWVDHLRGTVAFSQGLSTLFKEEGLLLLEVGPGNTLVTLASRHPDKGDDAFLQASLPHPKKKADTQSHWLNAVGQLWARGVAIDWSGFHQERQPRKVTLPTYPFQRQAYRLEGMSGALGTGNQAVKPVTYPPARHPDPSGWLHTVRWKSVGAAAVGVGDSILLIGVEGLRGDTLAEALEKQGHPVLRVLFGDAYAHSGSRITLRPGSVDDWQQLITSLADNLPKNWCHLAAMDVGLDTTSWMQTRAYGLQALASLGDMIPAGTRLNVVTRGGCDVMGLGPESSFAAALHGVVQCLGQECAPIQTRVVDVGAMPSGGPAAQRYATGLAAELGAREEAFMTVLQGRKRWQLETDTFTPMGQHPSALALGEGTYAVLGALCDVGLRVADWLAQKGCKLLLIDGAAPRSDQEGTLAQLQEQTQVNQITADTDAWGHHLGACSDLRGVLYIAREDEVHTLAESSLDSWQGSLLVGEALMAATDGLTLDFVLAILPLETTLGGPGRAKAAAMGRQLQACAQQAANRGNASWRCVVWDGHLQGDLTVAASPVLADVALMPDDTGFVMDALLAGDDDQNLLVSCGDYEVRRQYWRGAAVSDGEEGDTTEAVVVVSSKHARPDLANAYVAAEDPVEKVICSLWQDLLGIETVGVDDPFFELGGDSLIATQFLSHLRQHSLPGHDGVYADLSLEDLFDHPTPGALGKVVAERLSSDENEAPPPIEPAPRDGNLPMSFAQGRLWLMDRLDPGKTTFNLTTVAQLVGPLDVGVLKKALAALIERHEALRTVARLDGEEAYQEILEEGPLHFDFEDCREAENRDAAFKEALDKEVSHVFSLLEGPLLRFRLVQVEDTRYGLIVNKHHWISDGWSGELFAREMGHLYEAFAAGKPSPLPPITLQYVDFSVWQHNWLQGDVLDKQVDWWKRLLAGANYTFTVPSENERPPRPTHRGVSIRFPFDGAVTDRVKALAQAQNTSLVMVLQAGFFVLLRYRTGADDLLVGTDVANRNHKGCEQMMGFFVNQLPLRVRTREDLTFLQLLTEVRKVTLGAYAHQDLPFDKMVEALNPERNPAYSSLFQIKFCFLNRVASAASFGDMSMEIIEVERKSAQLDMILNLSDTEQGLVSSCEFSTDLYSPAFMERFHKQLQRVWELVVETPEISIKDICKTLENEDKQEKIAKQKAKGLGGLRKMGRKRRSGVKGR